MQGSRLSPALPGSHKGPRGPSREGPGPLVTICWFDTSCSHPLSQNMEVAPQAGAPASPAVFKLISPSGSCHILRKLCLEPKNSCPLPRYGGSSQNPILVLLFVPLCPVLLEAGVPPRWSLTLSTTLKPEQEGCHAIQGPQVTHTHTHTQCVRECLGHSGCDPTAGIESSVNSKYTPL